MVGKTGFEPATPWSQTKCSTKLSHFPIMVENEGLEPLTLCVQGRCSSQLSYDPIPYFKAQITDPKEDSITASSNKNM